MRPPHGFRLHPVQILEPPIRVDAMDGMLSLPRDCLPGKKEAPRGANRRGRQILGPGRDPSPPQRKKNFVETPCPVFLNKRVSFSSSLMRFLSFIC